VFKARSQEKNCVKREREREREKERERVERVNEPREGVVSANTSAPLANSALRRSGSAFPKQAKWSGVSP
jgi:hypothetical protein